MGRIIASTGIVYMYTNPSNGKKYVGQTWRLKKRKNQHSNMSGGNSGCRAFYSAIAKYGYDSFKFEILHSGILLQEELDALEQDEIKRNNSLAPNGYNLKTGGAHGKHSDDSKKKMSEGVRKARSMGKGQSQERIKKLSEKSKLKWQDASYREKWNYSMNIAREKRKEKTKLKRNELAMKDFEYKQTEEYKTLQEEKKTKVYIKMSEIGKKLSVHPNTIKARAEVANKTSISCYCETNNKIYKSASEASRDLGIDQGSISKILRGDGHSTGGYYFRKLNKKELKKYKPGVA